jgi:hypothetical protein
VSQVATEHHLAEVAVFVQLQLRDCRAKDMAGISPRQHDSRQDLLALPVFECLKISVRLACFGTGVKWLEKF